MADVVCADCQQPVWQCICGQGWHDAETLPPPETLVIAAYSEWGLRGNPIGQQAVWHFDGEWRSFPETAGFAYVNRWRFPTSAVRPQAAPSSDESAVPQGGAQ